jgi:hypothetical protein
MSEHDGPSQSHPDPRPDYLAELEERADRNVERAIAERDRIRALRQGEAQRRRLTAYERAMAVWKMSGAAALLAGIGSLLKLARGHPAATLAAGVGVPATALAIVLLPRILDEQTRDPRTPPAAVQPSGTPSGTRPPPRPSPASTPSSPAPAPAPAAPTTQGPPSVVPTGEGGDTAADTGELPELPELPEPPVETEVPVEPPVEPQSPPVEPEDDCLLHLDLGELGEVCLL